VIWAPAAYDAIFCRNVLMYFAPRPDACGDRADSRIPGAWRLPVPRTRRDAARRIGRVFICVTPMRPSTTRLRDSTEPTWRRPPQFVPRSASGGASAALDEAWFETIAKASERVAALMPGPIAASPPAGPATGPLGPGRPRSISLRQERFCRGAGSRFGRDRREPNGIPMSCFSKRPLLAHGGQLAAAEDACLRLLMIDQLNAGAHYVLALCREPLGTSGAGHQA